MSFLGNNRSFNGTNVLSMEQTFFQWNKRFFNGTNILSMEQTFFQWNKRSFNETNVLSMEQTIKKSRNTPSPSQRSDFYNELALKNLTFLINTQHFFLAFNCCFLRSNLFTVSQTFLLKLVVFPQNYCAQSVQPLLSLLKINKQTSQI